MTRFRGLTWDHPRGYDALAAAALRDPGLIEWHRQPLEGFESRPIEQICAEYDVVVLDHPHLGDALAAGCLQAVDALLPAEELASLRARVIGPCFESYVVDDRLWALPLDAAAQVSVARTDLLGEPMPREWATVEGLAARQKGFILSLAGPHAFLTLLSLCATDVDDFGSLDDGLLRPHHDETIDMFASLVRRSHRLGATANPIGILEAMAAGEGPTYCPLIFGYVTYASVNRPAPLTFADAPRPWPAGLPKTVLGGTGIAISARCRPDAALLDHLAWLLSPSAQSDFLPAHSGQPSARQAWLSGTVNAASGQFYRNTFDTLSHAHIRPRSQGFVPAQNRASAWLREELLDRSPPAESIRKAVNGLLAQGKPVSQPI